MPTLIFLKYRLLVFNQVDTYIDTVRCIVSDIKCITSAIVNVKMVDS